MQQIATALQNSGNDTYVILQPGMLTQLEPCKHYADTYLSMLDIEMLINVVGKPFFLLGMSMGAMRAIRFAASTHIKNRLLGVIALYCPFDALQPMRLSDAR